MTADRRRQQCRVRHRRDADMLPLLEGGGDEHALAPAAAEEQSIEALDHQDGGESDLVEAARHGAPDKFGGGQHRRRSARRHDGGGEVVVDGEDLFEPGELQHPHRLAGHRDELKPGALPVGGLQRLDQIGDARGVDVIDAGEIDDDVLLAPDAFEQQLAQSGRASCRERV